MPTQIPSRKPRALAAIVGAVSAAALLQFVPAQEGTVLKTYRDIGGVLTYCTGATEDAIAGKTYTFAECQDRLDYDLAIHAQGVMSCISVPLTTGQKVAFVDTAYNIGIRGFCGSSMARHANAGRMTSACQALMLWVNVNGKRVQGLVNRRTKVHAFCMAGVK